MFNRRRLPFVVAGACLVLASGAAAADPAPNSFTAASTPSHVKPATSATYTVTLTNSSSSEKEADRAKIAIATDFVVDETTVQASAGAVGDCVASTWVAEDELVSDGKINLERPGVSDNTRLCPGGTLTVQFAATSTAAEGSYTWATELFRGDEAFSLSGAHPTVEVDGTAPTLTIDQKPDDPSNSRSAAFTFTTSEPATECKLDDAVFAACVSPAGYGDLADGEHTFTVQATDKAGNTGQASYTWTIDATAPTLEITAKPSDLTNSTSASFAFTVSEAASIVCTLDDEASSPCSASADYSALADGPHTFTVSATDAAGNTSEAIDTWTIDTVPPTTAIIGTPSNPSNNDSPSFVFEASEPAVFECRLGGGSFASCASPTGYSDLADGQYTFTVKATDAANNSGPATSYSWTIDTNAPTVSITTKPPNPSNSASASFAFTVNEAAGTVCKLDGAAFSPCDSVAGYGGLSDGPHTFSVRATDVAGNTGEASYAWTVETRAPTATMASGPAALSNSRSATFAFSADEPSSFECRLDELSFAACSSPATYDGLGDGAHTFRVRPTDAVGNTGEVSAYSWTIDATAPETTLDSQPRSGTTAVSATFAFSASELASFECKLDGAAFAPCTSPTSYARLSRSGHSFEVRAIDPAGNLDPTPAAHRWTIAAAPRRAKTASALLAPRPGARVTSPPLLVWRRIAPATYYNVQLYRGSVKVLSAWPTRPRLRLRARWTYRGRKRRLSPGTYRWYVWPGYGRPSANRYGRLLGQSTFTVTPT